MASLIFVHAYQIYRNVQDNCLDSSDEIEDNEIEYITLGHLCSGIIDELADDDANHIGGEWHTVSKNKNSSWKKKVQVRHVTNFKTRSSI